MGGGASGAKYLERLRLLLEREERLRDPSLWSEVPSLDDILVRSLTEWEFINARSRSGGRFKS